MLYERWCQITAERRDEVALHDLAAGRQWTFAQLRAAAESRPRPADDIVPLRGDSREFLPDLLNAWRWHKVVCPLEAGQSPPVVPAPPPPCVHLKSTSATTGRSRWVAFTAAQLAADAENIVATMGLRPEWPNLGVISMAHSYGFSNLVLPLLLHGVPLVLGESPLPEALRRAAECESAITLAAVPALWRAWHEAKAIPPNSPLAISAGAPLPARLESAIFKACGVKVHNFYGSTECGGIAYDVTDTPRGDDAGIGSPMRNVTVSLNADGCLIVHSRAVGQTYWPEPAAGLDSGQFQTGDLAELKAGVVYLRGRFGDQINVAGRKVGPESIEQALLEHPAVRHCLVFGAPSRDADRTDDIVACIVANAPVTSDALKHFLLARIPPWQVPRAWQFSESLSENARGKISRTEWRRRYLEGLRTRRGSS
jgi:acyl-coenzyme A synthetase/AMP-(fatty) acid ligase